MRFKLHHSLLSIVFIALAPAAISANPPKSFDDIETMLRAPGSPRSLEAFLEALATQNPALFSGFTLMRESQSLQSASPDAPRAIVFGADGKLILTFNGKAGQTQFDHVEMMQFVDAGQGTGKFELMEIGFSP